MTEGCARCGDPLLIGSRVSERGRMFCSMYCAEKFDMDPEQRTETAQRMPEPTPEEEAHNRYLALGWLRKHGFVDDPYDRRVEDLACLFASLKWSARQRRPTARAFRSEYFTPEYLAEQAKRSYEVEGPSSLIDEAEAIATLAKIGVEIRWGKPEDTGTVLVDLLKRIRAHERLVLGRERATNIDEEQRLAVATRLIGSMQLEIAKLRAVADAAESACQAEGTTNAHGWLDQLRSALGELGQ